MERYVANELKKLDVEIWEKNICHYKGKEN